MGRTRWLIGAVVAALLVFVGGPWVYLNVIRDDAPERLSFEDRADADATGEPTDASPDASGDTDDGAAIDGTWTIGEGSVVGYRVTEVLFGQDADAVGRTSEVSGDAVIDGTTVTEANFTVDMTTVESDESRRDEQFRGRIMDTDTHPTATFELTEPLDFGEVPDDGSDLSVTAVGDLTLRGTTRSVSIELLARRAGGDIEVVGSLDISFEDWGIPDPSNFAATVGDTGELELLLVLTR